MRCGGSSLNWGGKAPAPLCPFSSPFSPSFIVLLPVSLFSALTVVSELCADDWVPASLGVARAGRGRPAGGCAPGCLESGQAPSGSRAPLPSPRQLLALLPVLRTLMGHKANICSLDFHPYGEFVASGSQDTNIKVGPRSRARGGRQYPQASRPRQGGACWLDVSSQKALLRRTCPLRCGCLSRRCPSPPAS